MAHPSQKNPNWGGTRPNSGRKPIKPEERRVKLGTTVAPETEAWLNQRWENERTPKGKAIDALVKMIQDDFLDA